MNEVFLQPAAFLAMAYGGMLAGLLMDVLRIPRRIWRARALEWSMDALFVLLAAAIGALSLYRATGGALRPYAAIGFLFGFALEQASLSALFFLLFHRILAKIRG